MLRDAEYAVLVEQSPVLVWRADTSAACDYFNQRWLEFTGRTMEQELGDGWASGVHPDDLARCVSIWRGSFERRVAFEMEYRLRRHDGAWRWLFDRGTPTFATDGTFVGYVGSCIDVTERVEAAAVLERRHAEEVQRLAGLLPICAHCKSVRDDQGYWRRVDAYLEAKTGLDVTHALCPNCLEEHYPD